MGGGGELVCAWEHFFCLFVCFVGVGEIQSVINVLLVNCCRWMHRRWFSKSSSGEQSQDARWIVRPV